MMRTHNYTSVSANHRHIANDLILCITYVRRWMTQNFLKLNVDKTEIVWVGSGASKSSGSLPTPFPEKPTKHVRHMGMIMNVNLNFQKQSYKKAFYHRRKMSKIRSFLSISDSEKLVHAFISISSRYDYYNILFAVVTKQALNKLKTLQSEF